MWVLAAHPLQPHQGSEEFWGVDNPRLHLMLVVVPVAPRGCIPAPHSLHIGTLPGNKKV